MSHRICLSAVLFCLFGGAGHSQPWIGETRIGEAPSEVPWVGDLRVGDKWVAEDDDNICGIKDLKKVSSPAKVDYDALWDATPQIKQMKEKKIDPESTEGKALRSQAKTLITKTCELVRAAKSYCGIWKAIKNEDGRKVPDVTDDVKGKLDD